MTRQFLWKFILIFLSISRFTLSADVTEAYPELKKFLFKEPKSKFRVGMGLNPVGMMKNRFFIGINVFELHWISEAWDLELLKAQLGLGFARDSYTGSKHFTLSISPKIKIIKYLSVGPLMGYEFVSFPDVSARLTQGNLFTPFEPFSSRGMIYGISFSEMIPIESNTQLTLHQSVYWQTYSTTTSSDGWTYVYERSEIENDPSHAIIEPSIVILLGISVRF